MPDHELQIKIPTTTGLFIPYIVRIMQIEIIANPVAGGGRAKKSLNNAEDLLEKKNLDYEIHWTRFPGHATKLANKLEPRSEILVSAGGDGTVMEVLNGVESPDTPVGIIPVGMGNDLSRCLGIPLDPSGAIRNLLEGSGERIDLGSAGERLFNFMGIGFPANVVRNVKIHKDGMTRGRFVYLFGLLRSITELSSYDIELQLEGEQKRCRASAVFVASCKYTGGGLNLIPHADPSDGILDVALIREVGRAELTMALRKVYSGTHVDHPKIEFFQARSVKIKARNQLREMFDGDLGGRTPTELKVIPEARKIIAPDGKTDI